PHVYLGYWVPDSAKMAYKARFGASEVLLNGQWQKLGDISVSSSQLITAQ
ncbi:MAG: hypothetical protein B7Z78_13995, partial [Rhodospirillales bacterium 20-60-12]